MVKAATRKIRFTSGSMKGKTAFVTFDDGKWMRVTPEHGDPLLSLDVPVGADFYEDVTENEFDQEFMDSLLRGDHLKSKRGEKE